MRLDPQTCLIVVQQNYRRTIHLLPQQRYSGGYTDPWEKLECMRFETEGLPPYTRDEGVLCCDVFPRPGALTARRAQGFGLHGPQEKAVMLGERAKISHHVNVHASLPSYHFD